MDINTWFESWHTSFSNVTGWVSNQWKSFTGVFSGIDFTVLYDWMPSDIQVVITSIIDFMLILAIILLLKKVFFTLGGH